MGINIYQKSLKIRDFLKENKILFITRSDLATLIMHFGGSEPRTQKIYFETMIKTGMIKAVEGGFEVKNETEISKE